MNAKQDLEWFDVRDWGVEGKGWDNTNRYFDRLPGHAKKVVSQKIWDQSRSATGMCAGFKTDSPEVWGRWALQSSTLREANMSTVNFSGLDLYARDKNIWRWVGWGGELVNRKPTIRLVGQLPEKMREYRVYLPMRNPILALEIGVLKGSQFKPVSPRRVKPIVHYGSSVVHGAYSSRPGMAHSSIVGRKVDRPIINLGFSGQARMELAVADLLAELDAEIFIIDPLPNMDAELVHERAEIFLSRLCAARPSAKVLMVESFLETHSWCRPDLTRLHLSKWKAYRKTLRSLRGRGIANLHYIQGELLPGNDNETTVDGLHPNDLGFMRMAECLTPVIQQLLGD